LNGESHDSTPHCRRPLGDGIIVFLIVLRCHVFRYIAKHQVGNRRETMDHKGSIESGFIALNGEAGSSRGAARRPAHVLSVHVPDP